VTGSDVLIVGAGPTGLVLALWLTKLGLQVRVLDKTEAPGTTSRALAIQARTLELYRQLDLADAVVERAHKVPAVNLWARGERKARISFEEIGIGLTPYSNMRIFPQDEHEKLLIARRAAMGVGVDRRTELIDYADDGDRIVAQLRHAGGDETCEAAYIAGCDGARSLVRETMGVGFPGGTYQHVFYVADVEASGPALDGELHVDLDDADFLAVFPLAGQGRARLIGTVRGERADRAETLRFEDVSDRAIKSLKVTVEQTHWLSTYRVHHRVAEHFRKGRSFLLGDAAHIHSPAGGQGMNTGIGDAINLAWKLKAAFVGGAPDALLDSYESERIAFARRLVRTTDQAFTVATAQGELANLIRIWVAPVVIPAALSFEASREWAFSAVSQIGVNYRRSPVSEGRAGRVHGGDRMPWVVARGIDNYQSLAKPIWQAQVYGAVSSELAASCAEIRLPLQAIPCAREHGHAGLMQNALYVLRPDSYVGLANDSGSPEVLRRYFTSRGISL
jgi:2-polyprenyl-6-methoxyphenol hydroxylase-like FAD-dependent oxidoreductase